MRHNYRSAARNLTALAVTAAATVMMAGCGSSAPSGTGALASTSESPMPGASASASPAGSATPTATSTPTSGAATKTSTATPYPSNYAQAILNAWKAKDSARLTLLTSSTTAHHMISGLGSVNQHWTHIRDDGAMGSTYASYYNSAGDLLVLRLVNATMAAHKYHAGTLDTYDKMSYPSDPTAYVKKFVDGWIDGNVARMRLLSGSGVTNHFLTLTTPDSSYTVGPAPQGGAAGTDPIEIKEASVSLDQTVKVAFPVLGGPHAIEDCLPTCIP